MGYTGAYADRTRLVVVSYRTVYHCLSQRKSITQFGMGSQHLLLIIKKSKAEAGTQSKAPKNRNKCSVSSKLAVQVSVNIANRINHLSFRGIPFPKARLISEMRLLLSVKLAKLEQIICSTYVCASVKDIGLQLLKDL